MQGLRTRTEVSMASGGQSRGVDGHLECSSSRVRDIPGDPEAKILCSQCRRPRFDTWWGN